MNNKKILFHLCHPAHFHLLKNVIKSLKNTNEIFVIIKQKDVLVNLLKSSGLPFINILPETRSNNFLGLLYNFFLHTFRFLKFCKSSNPDLLVGSSSQIAIIGKLLSIPSINLNEDDVSAISLFSKITFPLTSTIVSPISCDMGPWSNKSIKYNSYHELAYLHKNNFTPNKKTAEKYISLKKPYAILRLSSLNAYHDVGISGISNNIADSLINMLKNHGKIIISSERPLNSKLDKYMVNIDPIDFHDVLYHSYLFIGDSQTVAAEAGVLGIPFVRFNDFVGRLGYLDEIEKNYKLGYGILPSEPEKLVNKVEELLSMRDREKIFAERKNHMLAKKLDLSSFLTWFISNYPESLVTLRKDNSYTKRFIS